MRKCITVHTCDDFTGWVAHQKVFSVACNSDPKTLAALQTVKSVFVPDQRHRLDADKFPCSRLVVTSIVC